MCISGVGYRLNSGLSLCFRALLAFTLSGVCAFLAGVFFPAESVADKANKVSTRITYYITRDYQEVWEGGQRIEVIKHYRVNGQKVATRDKEGLKYNHSDHLGSAAMISDEKGNKIKAYWYTPYGSEAKEDGAAIVRYKYNNKEHDDTGLYYYIARYHDSEVGRFMSADSILPSVYDSQQLNRFTYVRSNPIRLIDPDGHTAAYSMGVVGYTYKAANGEALIPFLFVGHIERFNIGGSFTLEPHPELITPADKGSFSFPGSIDQRLEKENLVEIPIRSIYKWGEKSFIKGVYNPCLNRIYFRASSYNVRIHERLHAYDEYTGASKTLGFREAYEAEMDELDVLSSSVDFISAMIDIESSYPEETKIREYFARMGAAYYNDTSSFNDNMGGEPHMHEFFNALNEQILTEPGQRYDPNWTPENKLIEDK